MDVVATVGADQEAAPVVEPGEGAFDEPSVLAEPGAMSALTPRDHGFDAALPEQPAVFVVVVAAVGEQGLGSSSWPADTAADGWYPVEQLEQLGNVVAVPAGQRPGERDPAAVYEDVVFAACPAAVNWAGTRF